ncbi:MAG: hypothetical protein ABIQ81_07380 [Novosphingobium sp.]
MRWLVAAALVLLSVPVEAAPARRAMLGEATVLAEWRKAENRRHCAPLAFATTRAGAGRARRANFGGGWGAAFDRPGLRSAFGVAGAGLLPGDEAPIGDQRAALAQQWPYVRALPGLKPQTFAGYGVEGAKPFTTDNPEARGRDLLAYVRVPGERCLYNVWSKLGRAHLELLLDSLRQIRR